MERTITALEVQKRNKERVNVYLDGEFAFGLSIMDAASLRKGQTLSEEAIRQLQAQDEVTRSFERAVSLLARRPYSIAEIRRKLAAKQIAPDVIDETIARLEQRGYVDDHAFAEFWVENREQFRPRGPRALRHELRQKGIGPTIIDDVLAGIDFHDSAYRAAQKRLRRLRGLTRRDFQTRLGSYLGRRGFSYAITREVIEQIIQELEDEQPDYFKSEQE